MSSKAADELNAHVSWMREKERNVRRLSFEVRRYGPDGLIIATGLLNDMPSAELAIVPGLFGAAGRPCERNRR
jgi:hypothetical protein